MLHQKKRSEASLSDEWETPNDLFVGLSTLYKVDVLLDVCATEDNTKCVNFFSKKDDALKKPWLYDAWCNPPHSQTSDFVRKAYVEWKEHNINIMLIIPTNTMSSNYWHQYIESNAEYHPIKGRIHFLQNGERSPFPSRNAYVCVIFRKS
jgi:site-specific DNA-methyltransferase (adenine-specific)